MKNMIGGSSRRVAFFGGSFDPPHLGHLAIARAVRNALRLDRVLFAPVGVQPLKPNGSTASFDDRVAMTELAIAGERAFELSCIDAPNPDGHPNYTLDTLHRLRSGLSAGSELFCLVGADAFFSLRHWHGAADIPFAASLVVASRPGENLEFLATALPAGITLDPGFTTAVSSDPRIELRTCTVRDAAGRTAGFHILTGLEVEISASDIRDQLRGSADAGATPACVPATVAEYIRERGLYR